ncbi:MAG: class I SAM-dependent methyltransferase [Deltaproteobacteria bacterium]|nr:class I SAM-dependent methyltransferase [Deltaproteobacteria bacterium]
MTDHFRYVAGVYDRIIRPPDPERLIRILKLPVAGPILDLGGGTGRVSSRLRSLVGGAVVTDFSLPMLRQTAAKGGLLPVRAMGEALPFPDGTFDRVLIVDALHHFRNQKDAIRESLRVLKPGGRLAIEEPDIRRFVVRAVAFLENLILMRSRFYTPMQIMALIEGQGLTARIEGYYFFRVWIVADKKS